MYNSVLIKKLYSLREKSFSPSPYILAGAAVYSSELLLNGIVTQKLEYERYYMFIVLFTDLKF